MRLLLDTMVLGQLCHPKAHGPVKDWLSDILKKHSDTIVVAVAEVADYELRREFLRGIAKNQIKPKSLKRLNALASLLDYQPLTTGTMRDAAQLWADARNFGYPTSHKKALDGDVILAAQARENPAIVVTENRKHLTVYGVQAEEWSDIQPPASSEPSAS